VRNGDLTYTFVRTDTLTGVLDAMQYFDDGPCETALRNGEEVRVDDVLSDENWPLFAPRSVRPPESSAHCRCHCAGVLSSLSLPLRRGPSLVGSVNLYGDTTHAFTGKEEELANTFGVHVQSMISHADLSTPPLPGADVSLQPGEQAVIDDAMDVLADSHAFERATVERRLSDAAARVRISPLSAARAILLSTRDEDIHFAGAPVSRDRDFGLASS
jgi:hypothetical protein